MPNLIAQDLLVRNFVIKNMRITLQPNIPNSGIDCTLLQGFGFLPFPKASKTSQ